MKIVKLQHDSFFKKSLPVLRINDEFIEKEKILDFLIKILYDNKKESCFSELFLINSVKSSLSSCIQFFIWINSNNTIYKYRDPYWICLNPIKKFQHFLFLKNLKNVLNNSGIHDSVLVTFFAIF